MKWFRFYSEALHDPKVQRLHPSLFKHWINLLCLASESDERGVLPSLEDVAFALRIKPAKAAEVLTQLERAGLLDVTQSGRYLHHGWTRRQRESDDVAKRVRQHREEKTPEESENTPECNVTKPLPKTLPKRTVEADTDTESDTEPEATDVAVEAPPAELADATDVELYVARCIQAVRGAAKVPDSEVVLHLREVIANRGSPPTDEAIRQDALGFRDYWNDRRKSQPANTKWSGWKRAMTNWFSRTRDTPTPIRTGKGRVREPDFSGIEGFSETMSALEHRR